MSESDPAAVGVYSSPDAVAAPVAQSGVRGSGAKRICAFFVLLGVLAVMADFAISAVLRGITIGDFGVWNRIVAGEINSDVIISGSSRALTHYDSRILQEKLGHTAYNIGLNGSQTDMQVARVKTYLRHNRAPKLLIQNLDAFTFQVTHGEVYDPGQYLPYRTEPELYEALSRVNPDTWKWRYIPLYGYATQDLRLGWLFGMRDRFAGAQRETHFLGFKPRYTEWTEDFAQFRANNPNGFEVKVEDEGVRQVEDLLRFCASRGIKVALVYSPEYAEVQDMTRNRAEIFARFAAMAEQYGATFIDFSGSPISSDRSLFYNSQHLNADGAMRFTAELADKLAPVIAAASGGSSSGRM
jgi:hypothetical protein